MWIFNWKFFGRQSYSGLQPWKFQVFCTFSVCRVVCLLVLNYILKYLNREGVTAVEEPVDCPNISTIACKYAAIFQEFLQHTELPVWNRFKNCGFWRQLTVYLLDSVLKILWPHWLLFLDMSANFLFHYVFLSLSEANWFFKVREGRSNGNVVDAETFDGIAEVMLIVQVIF